MNRGFLRKVRSVLKRRDIPLVQLRQQASEIAARVRDTAMGLQSGTSSERVVAALEASAAQIDSTAAQTQTTLSRLAVKRIATGDVFRLMQTTYQTLRIPKRPDLLRTLQVITFFWMLETVMAGGVLVSGGRMDVAGGFAFGAIFALTNIIIGVLTGFLGLRYLNHRQPYDIFGTEEEAKTAFNPIRLTAKIGTGAGVCAEAVLIFSAARLRALGSHEGVFNFEEVGFWATYNDSLALVITAIGVCSAVLAVREGYNGISDAIPGYGAAYDQATSKIDGAADELAEDAIVLIEDAVDAALREAEPALDDATDGPAGFEAALLRIARDIDAHNDAVRAAKEVEETAARKKAGIDRFITGDALRKLPPLDLSAYTALILPPVDEELSQCRQAGQSDAEPIRTTISHLEAARTRALADIHVNLADYHASAPNLDSLFTEGNDHETS